MKPNRIILIRHGESEGNVDKSLYNQKPDYALELTEKGLAQAKEAGHELKKIVEEESLFFYISPMWRTRSTFEQISLVLDPGKIQYIEEPRIRKQEWGHLRNEDESKRIEANRDAYGTLYFRIPDGESAADVFDRVSDFFGTLHRDFRKNDFPQNAIIVTHGMSIRLFLMRWFHWTVEEFELVANPMNCQIIMLEKDENDKFLIKSEIKKWNSAYHPYSRPIHFPRT